MNTESSWRRKSRGLADKRWKRLTHRTNDSFPDCVGMIQSTNSWELSGQPFAMESQRSRNCAPASTGASPSFTWFGSRSQYLAAGNVLCRIRRSTRSGNSAANN